VVVKDREDEEEIEDKMDNVVEGRVTELFSVNLSREAIRPKEAGLSFMLVNGLRVCSVDIKIVLILVSYQYLDGELQLSEALRNLPLSIKLSAFRRVNPRTLVTTSSSGEEHLLMWTTTSYFQLKKFLFSPISDQCKTFTYRIDQFEATPRGDNALKSTHFNHAC
jgi:hypothetical protein